MRDLRDLTRSEIENYLQFAGRDDAAENFNQAQTQLIGTAAINARLVPAYMIKLDFALDNDISLHDFLLTLWVWAFQMGRECESRLQQQTRTNGSKRISRETNI